MRKLVILTTLFATACQSYTGSTGLTGATGQDGTNGTNATANVRTLSNPVCSEIILGYYGQATKHSYNIYSEELNSKAKTCKGSHYGLNLSHSAVWLNESVLAVFATPNSIRVLNFN